MDYDERTLRKVRAMLTSETGRTESYEATLNWINEQLNTNKAAPKVPRRWETYNG